MSVLGTAVAYGIQAGRLGEACDHVGLLNPDTDSWLHVLVPAGLEGLACGAVMPIDAARKSMKARTSNEVWRWRG